MDENENVFSGEKQVFKAAEFEGPLDLLLFQIQSSKINIYDIPIAEITDQFLAYIKEHEESGLKNMADFYKMAADLLYIKSRMLLPVEVEFDDEYEDPRQELVDRLLEYQKFKRYTDLLTGVVTSDSFYVPRKENLFAVPFTDEDLFKGITLQDLLDTFQSLIKQVSPNKLFNVYEEVTVNEKITLMQELFETKEMITISEVIVHMDQYLHIICAFMAILEATKFRMIIFTQKEPNGEIYIQKRPKDYDESRADEYDKEYDQFVENDLADADDFSILTDEAKAVIENAERLDEEEAERFRREEDEVEFEGDEEDLLDDDEEDGE